MVGADTLGQLGLGKASGDEEQTVDGMAAEGGKKVLDGGFVFGESGVFRGGMEEGGAADNDLEGGVGMKESEDEGVDRFPGKDPPF